MDKTVEYTERELYYSTNIGSVQRDLYMDDSSPQAHDAKNSIYRKVNIETMQYIVDVLTGYYGYKALKTLNDVWMVEKPLLPQQGENFARVRCGVVGGKLGYYFRPHGLRVRGLWLPPDADKILCGDVQGKIAEMQDQLDVTEDTGTTQGSYSKSVATMSSISNKECSNECSNAVSIAGTPTEERWSESLATSDYIGYEELTDESLYGMTSI
jgi:hypothetical protein